MPSYKVLKEDFWNAEETKYTAGGVLMTPPMLADTTLEDIAKDIILARHLDQKLNIVRYETRGVSEVVNALRSGNNMFGYVVPAEGSINVGVLPHVSNPYILYPDLTRWFKDEMECVMRITKDLSRLSKKPITTECHSRFLSIMKQNVGRGGVWDYVSYQPFNDTKDKSQWFYVANFEYRKNIPLLNPADINKYVKLLIALKTGHEGILDDADGDKSPEQLSRRVRGKKAIFEVLGDSDPEMAFIKAGVFGIEARTKFLVDKKFKLLGFFSSMYHNNHKGARERKFTHDNGAEIVLDGDTGRVIIDPRWRGTFNYGSTAFSLKHVVEDMFPYAIEGTGANDTSSWISRVIGI